MPKTAQKTPVFFVATKVKKEPVRVSFFTKAGAPVDFEAVKKVKTKEGVRFYVKTSVAKRR